MQSKASQNLTWFVINLSLLQAGKGDIMLSRASAYPKQLEESIQEALFRNNCEKQHNSEIDFQFCTRHLTAQNFTLQETPFVFWRCRFGGGAIPSLRLPSSSSSCSWEARGTSSTTGIFPFTRSPASILPNNRQFWMLGLWWHQTPSTCCWDWLFSQKITRESVCILFFSLSHCKRARSHPPMQRTSDYQEAFDGLQRKINDKGVHVFSQPWWMTFFEGTYVPTTPGCYQKQEIHSFRQCCQCTFCVPLWSCTKTPEKVLQDSQHNRDRKHKSPAFFEPSSSDPFCLAVASFIKSSSGSESSGMRWSTSKPIFAFASAICKHCCPQVQQRFISCRQFWFLPPPHLRMFDSICTLYCQRPPTPLPFFFLFYLPLNVTILNSRLLRKLPNFCMDLLLGCQCTMQY